MDKTDIKKFWEEAERANRVKKIEEERVFSLNEEEAKKCRFKIIDQNYRMAECTVHQGKLSHGYRLHPPHLFDLRDGVLYHKVKGKFVRFIPDFEERAKQKEKEEDNI